MKKRKIKLLASITSLVLVVAVMAVGVWAATSVTLNVTSTATFTATGIVGNVKMFQTAAAGQNVKANDTNLPTELASAVDVYAFDLDTVQNDAGTVALAFEFADQNADGFLNPAENVVVTFTFNNTGAYDFTVAYVVTPGGNIIATPSPASPVTVTAGSHAEVAFTFAVASNLSGSIAATDPAPSIEFTIAK